MKALVCKEFGEPDILVMEDIAEPTVAAGTVKIQVHCVGLNFPDTLMIAGKYQFKPAFPFSPGMETAGIVTEVGDGVTDIKVGDRVMANHGHGGFAEYVVAPAEATYVIPDNMPFDQAAGFPVTYGTTDAFLVHFDLETIKDLPGMAELRATGLLAEQPEPLDLFSQDEDGDLPEDGLDQAERERGDDNDAVF